MNRFFQNHRYLVLTGNYGSGKTELALNLALKYAQTCKTTLVDLDIVNPYFRSGEKAEEMQQAGVRMLMPTYAMTTVDIPALPAEIQSVFEVPSDRVIFDVGGDDTGAMRPLTREVDDIIDLAERIQNRGRLKIDMLINNTNLADMTEPAMVEDGEKITLICAKKLGVEEVITAGKKELLEQCRLNTPVMDIKRYMAPEWMEQV